MHAVAQDEELIGPYGDKTVCSGHASLRTDSHDARVGNVAYGMAKAVEELGIPMLLSPAAVADPKMDEKALVMYLAYFQNAEGDEWKAMSGQAQKNSGE